MSIRTFLGFPGGSDGQESAYNVGYIQSLGWEDPLEEKVYPLQYSGLENSMDSTVHGVTKNWTWLSVLVWSTVGYNPWWGIVVGLQWLRHDWATNTGLSWWPNSWDSTLPLQEAWFCSLDTKLRSYMLREKVKKTMNWILNLVLSFPLYRRKNVYQTFKTYASHFNTNTSKKVREIIKILKIYQVYKFSILIYVAFKEIKCNEH